MKSAVYFLWMLCVSIVLAGSFDASAQTSTSGGGGSDEKVGDTTEALDLGTRTVTVHQSLTNDANWYIAPLFTFLHLDDSKKEIAALARGPTGHFAIHAAVQLVAPAVREEVGALLRSSGKSVAKVGNLPLTRVEVSLGDEKLRLALGAKKAIFERPPHGQRQDLTIYLDEADGELANEAITQINDGKVEFIITYFYNEIQVDKSVIKINAEHIRSCKAYTDVRQAGAYLMNAAQARNFADQVSRQLTATHIRSLGGENRRKFNGRGFST